jgi:hypothetical protein
MSTERKSFSRRSVDTLRGVCCQSSRLAIIWPKGNITAGEKRLLKEMEHWEISSSEGDTLHRHNGGRIKLALPTQNCAR